jgi:hypothetical protein
MQKTLVEGDRRNLYGAEHMYVAGSALTHAIYYSAILLATPEVQSFRAVKLVSGAQWTGRRSDAVAM